MDVSGAAPRAAGRTARSAWSMRGMRSSAAPGVRQARAFNSREDARGAKAGQHVDEGNPVVAFLKEIGLQHYAGALLRCGFDDMETLLDIEEADMKDLGMAPYDMVKLRKRLQDMRRCTDPGLQLDESHPVVAFLLGADLSQHAESLLRNGFDDMETLLEIEDADLKELGIPRGHVMRLRKHLRAYQGAQGAQACPARPTWGSQAAQDAQVCPMQPPGRHPLAQSHCSAGGRGRHGAPAAAVISSAPVPTERMKTAVEQSWEVVQQLGTYAVGELLYKNLFEIAPEAVELFPMEVRYKYREWTLDEACDEGDVYESPALRKLFAKVVHAVGFAVGGLKEPGRMVPMLTQLGARHIDYGVAEEHWQLLGQALNRTLRTCLGEAFTPEVEFAWTTVYGFISAVMIEGLRGAIAARDAARAGCQGPLPGVGDSHSVGSGSAVSKLPSTDERADVAHGRPGPFCVAQHQGDVALAASLAPALGAEGELQAGPAAGSVGAEGPADAEPHASGDSPSSSAASTPPAPGPLLNGPEAPTLLRMMQVSQELGRQGKAVLRCS